MFRTVFGDITRVKADVIVNPTDGIYSGGGNTDLAIHTAAGLDEMRKACDSLPYLEVGQVQVTDAFNLQARKVFHTRGPIWNGGKCNEELALRTCYESCLYRALSMGYTSIAFPLIASGTFGYPEGKAMEVAIGAIRDFLRFEDNMEVIMVLYDPSAEEPKESPFGQYLMDNYSASKPSFDSSFSCFCADSLEMPSFSFSSSESMEEKIVDVFEADERSFRREHRNRPKPQYERKRSSRESLEEAWEERIPNRLEDFACYTPPKQKTPADKPRRKLIEEKNEGFVLPPVTDSYDKVLGRLLGNKKPAEVYKRGLITRHYFSRLKSGSVKNPSKGVMLGLCIGLMLNMEDALELLQAAGYTLSTASVRDIYISYCITNKIYDSVKINIELSGMDAEPIGTNG